MSTSYIPYDIDFDPLPNQSIKSHSWILQIIPYPEAKDVDVSPLSNESSHNHEYPISYSALNIRRRGNSVDDEKHAGVTCGVRVQKGSACHLRLFLTQLRSQKAFTLAAYLDFLMTCKVKQRIQ